MSKITEILKALYGAVEALSPNEAPGVPFERWEGPTPLTSGTGTAFRAFVWEVEGKSRGSRFSSSSSMSERAALALRIAYPTTSPVDADPDRLGVDAIAAADCAQIQAALTRKRPLPSQSVEGVGPLLFVSLSREPGARVLRFSVDYLEPIQ